MRLNATRLGSIASSRSFGDQLDDLAGQVPSLDLNFAQNKSLIDDYSGTTLATHTRASSGTYVDSTGVLRSAVTNLLLRSEEFDSGWTGSESNTTVTANTSTAPNGTITADTINFTNASSFRYQIISGTPAGTTYTFSVWLASGTKTQTVIRIAGTSTGSGGQLVVSLTPTLTRYSVTVTIPSGNTAAFVGFENRVGVGGGNGSTGTIIAWGAQLEQSAIVGEYVPTTSTINSAPRFDHNPATGESLGLLVEEARTNSIRNNTMVGAVAGTPGTGPTNWGVGASTDLTRTVVGTGIENGINYVDIRYTGTVTATRAQYVFFEASNIIAATSGQSWTGSVWLKIVAGSLSNITSVVIQADTRDSSIVYVNTPYGVFITPTTTFTRFSGTGVATGTTAWIQPFIVFNTATSGLVDITLRIGLPQLELGAFATSVIPTTSATVTRAADVAQITGSNFGTTRTNLLVRSEEFDNAGVWPKSQSSVSSNTATSPAGTLTADFLVENTASGLQHYATQTVTISANTVYTATVYVKANTRSSVRFGFLNNLLSSGAFAHFNVSTGVISTQTTAGTASNVSFSIETAASGWYRCRTTCTVDNSSTLGTVFIGLVDGTNNATYTGDGTSGLFLWGAQLEVGSAVTPYIQSPSVFTSRASSGTYVGSNGLIQTAATNEARYDHDPVSLISRGLLLEEARTNLALDSEDFSAATWTRLGTTYTVDTVASPTGATTADTLLETATTTEHILYSTVPHTFTTATHSIYVKPNGRTNVALRFFCANNDWVATVFSLTGNGSVTQSSAGSSSGFSAVSRSIANAGNGWYRISMTATQTSRATFAAVLDLCTSSTPTLATASGSETYLGDVTKGVYAWGSQLEAASTASSYIPTTASTVTRAADISTSVATSVFESSWYRQDEGTIYGDAQTPFAVTGFPVIVDGRVSSTDIVQIGFVTESLSVGYIKATNADQAVMYNTGLSGVRRRRVAFGMAVDNFAISTNGGSLVTDSSGSMPTNIASIFIGSASGSAALNGTIKRLTYWPTRLSNEVLQRITQ